MPEKLTSPWSLPYPTSVGEVKLGATDIEELAVKLNTIFSEKFLVYKSYAGPATLKSGELAKQEKNGETFTLPAATTANQIIACMAGAITSAKITTSGGAKIYGDFIGTEATITLGALQHVVLQSDGANWLIIAGEPKREQKYTARAEKTVNTAISLPSATRPFTVVADVQLKPGTASCKFLVGGILVSEFFCEEGNPRSPRLGTSFKVPPGQTWEAQVINASGLFASYLEE